MQTILALCFLGLAQASSYLVVCKQEQRPKQLVRFLPTSAGALAAMDIQTAVPYEGNVSSLPGTWSFEEVRSGSSYVGLAGLDEISGVGFFSFEIGNTKFQTAQGLVGVLSAAIASSNNWVFSSYLDWASCAAGPQSQNTQIGTLTGYSFSSSMTTKSALVALAQRIPVASAPLMAAMSLSSTFPAGRSSVSWDIALMCVDMPDCTLVGRTNVRPLPSGDRGICQLAVVPTARAASSASGRASSYFAWKDLQLGQSLASSKHILAQYCDLFLTAAPKPLDVLFSIDNSGSMASWQAAVAELGNAIAAVLGSTGIDWRIGLVTSAHYDFYAPGTCTATSCASATGVTSGTYTCRYFTTNINLVKAWLTQGQTTWVGAGGPCGTGTEMTMFVVQMMFTSPPGVPNSAESFMPRTAQTVASLAPNTAFRQATNVVVVFLGDADDQYYGGSTSGAVSAATGITLYLNFFLSMRSQFNGGLFFAGIICPDNQVCGETQRNPRVIRSVLNQFPDSVIGSITSVASIQATLDLTIKKIVAQSSPYILTQPSAVSGSVQVLLDASKVLGPNCNNSNNEIPRSRVDGFDVESGRIILYGGCRPSSNLQPLVANYYYWVLTQCGDGIVQTDGGSGGEQCDPLVKSTTDCCDDNCKFITNPSFVCVPPGGSSCGSGNRTCSSSGVCTSTACPEYCVACGETERNFCTISVGCTNNVCSYRNRSCTPIGGCNKRICSRTTPNSGEIGLMGECVPISAEQGYICDTNYCKLDACGWCGGDNSTCKGCDGNVPPVGGTALKVDICGICGGDGTTCCSCRPSEQNPKVCGPFAAKFDSCQVCDGDDRSCVDCDAYVCSLFTQKDPTTGIESSFPCTTDAECTARGAQYCGTDANIGQKGALRGYCVTACLNGSRGVDNCGKCKGDGSSCLPTFDIQANFATLSTGQPACLTATNPCSCAAGDICCQLDWSFSTALGILYSGSPQTSDSVTCSAKVDRCDPLADTDGICVCDPTPTDANGIACTGSRCCYSYTIKIQQILLNGQTVTNVAQLVNLLSTNGGILTSTPHSLDKVGTLTSNPAPLLTACGSSCTIRPTTATAVDPTGGCCQNRACVSEISIGGYTQSQCNIAGGTFLLNDPTCLNTRCSTVVPPSIGPATSGGGPPAGVTSVSVTYTFPTTANSALSPLAQDTLLKQTITELIAQGVLPAPPAGVSPFTFYSGTVTVPTPLDGTVKVEIYPVGGSWPAGTPPAGPVVRPGTPVNPLICTTNALCSGQTATQPTTTPGTEGASCDCGTGGANCGCEANLNCVDNRCTTARSAAATLTLFA